MDINLKQAVSFTDAMNQHRIDAKRSKIDTLQLNIGRKCNQSCIHCHVNASPARTEEMSIETMNRVLALLSRRTNIKTVDITGGAPELNPNFRYLVTQLKKLGIDAIDRCNLTVLFENGQETTPEFLADYRVLIVASLPCYTEANVNQQRGNDTYPKSIKALKRLNKLGYGLPGSGRVLNLVYNPLGAFLPGDQNELEVDYKRILWEEHQIIFNKLFTITNMPINRFAQLLIREGTYEEYTHLLHSKFNPIAAEEIMCKHQLSISWDGKIYDCDFNQALDIPVHSDKMDIWAIDDFEEVTKEITYAGHCFGCTAGCGSSCQGKLA